MGYKIVFMKARDLAFLRDTLEGINVERLFALIRNSINEISKFLGPFISSKLRSQVQNFGQVSNMLTVFGLMRCNQKNIFNNKQQLTWQESLEGLHMGIEGHCQTWLWHSRQTALLYLLAIFREDKDRGYWGSFSQFQFTGMSLLGRGSLW